MKFESESTALAWSNAKNAALYFDHIIPANLVDLRRTAADDPIYYVILQKLLPPALVATSKPGNVTGLADIVTTYVAHYLMTFPEAVGIKQLKSGQSLEERAREQLPQMLDAFIQLVRTSQVRDFAIYGERLLRPDTSGESDPCLILSELSVVNTDDLSWQHLLEFREDKETVKKLRRLRRFVYSSYQGKALSFVKEDIEERIEQYNEATRVWGFPLVKGLLEIALTGQVAAAFGAVLGSAMFGVPLEAAAAVGASFTVGKGVLSIAQRKREVGIERERNPVAYLVEAQSLAKRT